MDRACEMSINDDVSSYNFSLGTFPTSSLSSAQEVIQSFPTTEALLKTLLTPEERRAWLEQLEREEMEEQQRKLNLIEHEPGDNNLNQNKEEHNLVHHEDEANKLQSRDDEANRKLDHHHQGKKKRELDPNEEEHNQGLLDENDLPLDRLNIKKQKSDHGTLAEPKKYIYTSPAPLPITPRNEDCLRALGVTCFHCLKLSTSNKDSPSEHNKGGSTASNKRQPEKDEAHATLQKVDQGDGNEEGQQQPFVTRTPNDSNVCFRKTSHPATRKWHMVIKLYSLKEKEFPVWKDEYCDFIKDKLRQEYNIQCFRLCRDYEQGRRINGNWYVATDKVILEKTKRFLDDRKPKKGARLLEPTVHNAKGKVNKPQPARQESSEINKTATSTTSLMLPVADLATSFMELRSNCSMAIQVHRMQILTPTTAINASLTTLLQSMEQRLTHLISREINVTFTNEEQHQKEGIKTINLRQLQAICRAAITLQRRQTLTPTTSVSKSLTDLLHDMEELITSSNIHETPNEGCDDILLLVAQPTQVLGSKSSETASDGAKILALDVPFPSSSLKGRDIIVSSEKPEAFSVATSSPKTGSCEGDNGDNNVGLFEAAETWLAAAYRSEDDDKDNEGKFPG